MWKNPQNVSKFICKCGDIIPLKKLEIDLKVHLCKCVDHPTGIFGVDDSANVQVEITKRLIIAENYCKYFDQKFEQTPTLLDNAALEQVIKKVNFEK